MGYRAKRQMASGSEPNAVWGRERKKRTFIAMHTQKIELTALYKMIIAVTTIDSRRILVTNHLNNETPFPELFK